MKRRFLLSYIRGISISKITDEFVIHCSETEYDYQFVSAKKKKIIEIIANCYFKETKFSREYMDFFPPMSVSYC